MQKWRVRTDACPALKDTICRSEIRPKYDVTGGLTREVQAFVLLQDGSISFFKNHEKEGCPDYIFYDGPPTANGKPHIGHVLTRVIKDMIPRYRTMKGYMVPRKAGWDTHGLPVELEVEKLLGLD